VMIASRAAYCTWRADSWRASQLDMVTLRHFGGTNPSTCRVRAPSPRPWYPREAPTCARWRGKGQRGAAAGDQSGYGVHRGREPVPAAAWKYSGRQAGRQESGKWQGAHLLEV
jgi:hypothetical protein